MINAENFKPYVTELIDMINHQREIINQLKQMTLNTDNDEKVLAALQKYFDKLSELDDALVDIVHLVDTTSINEFCEKLQRRKIYGREN